VRELSLSYAVVYARPSLRKVLIADKVGTERKGLSIGQYRLAIGIAVLPWRLIFGFLYRQFAVLTAIG
jgi:hypothetical protein